MPKRKTGSKRESLWEVIRFRAKGQYLGTVKAADEAGALKEFKLSQHDAKRLIVRPYGE